MTPDEKLFLMSMLDEMTVSPNDILDVIRAMDDVKSRTGWGRVDVIFEAGDVAEIVTSHRRKPKMERRGKNGV
jgi:hypothetical protein